MQAHSTCLSLLTISCAYPVVMRVAACMSGTLFLLCSYAGAQHVSVVADHVLTLSSCVPLLV